MATTIKNKPKADVARNGKHQPTWDIAAFFPLQGDWTEEEFLDLDSAGGRLIELNDGFLDILPMPDMFHQDIMQFLFLALLEYVNMKRIGRVYVAPMPVRLWKKQMREPDVVFLASERIKDKRKPPEGADLVMEVVSPDPEDRKRDLKEKRRVYAKAKIPEYWIVDPKEKAITVLTLSGKSYKVHGVFQEGDEATSKLLTGFKAAVTDVFAAGEEK